MQNNSLSGGKAINYWAVIPAAGTGMRMNNKTPKQYLKIHDKEIILHTINKLLNTNIFAKIIVVLAANDNYFSKLKISNNDRIITTIGGSQRYHSVMNGIKEIQKTQKYSPDDWVLVHDAARPCLNPHDINLLITKLENDPVGGILGYPASDTIKVISNDGKIQHTPDRSVLWHAVTPQMFRMGVLLDALDHCIKNNIAITDEASAIEVSDHKPKIFRSSVGNLKITTTEDIALAEYYLSQNQGK